MDMYAVFAYLPLYRSCRFSTSRVPWFFSDISCSCGVRLYLSSCECMCGVHKTKIVWTELFSVFYLRTYYACVRSVQYMREIESIAEHYICFEPTAYSFCSLIDKQKRALGKKTYALHITTTTTSDRPTDRPKRKRYTGKGTGKGAH